MKYKSTAEYKAENQAIKDEYKKIDAVRDALQQTLWGKLKLLCSKNPEAPVTNIIYDTPKPTDFFPAKMLVKKPRRWNPNFFYAINYNASTLLSYIEQIEKTAENQ